MAVATPNLTVEIDGESYSLTVVPAESSAVVLAEKDKLLGAVDLKTLVEDLGRVGGFIRVAYNGIGAAGPRFTELQIEIQRLGYDVTKLCDKSALTVSKFKKASSIIITDLQATYEYLLDNLEEMALETLTAVSKVAGEMEKAAMELHEDFKAQERKVEDALEGTQRAKGEEARRIIELKKEREQLEENRKAEEVLLKDAAKLEREAEAQRHHLEEKEDEAIRDIASLGPLKSVANAFTRSVGIGDVFDDKAAEKQASHWRDKRIEALEKENECRQQRHSALSRMTEFATKIKNCTTEENMADAAADSLHEAIGVLKELSAVMMQAAQFWKQMQDHCRSLAESEMQRQVEKAMKYPEEKRLKVWTSNGFKRKAVQFYAGWVALHGVCAVYVEQIKHTQQDLYRYIKENPTYEQSRQNVKTLAEEFLSDLQRGQEAIAEKEFQAQEEIKALGDSESV